MDLNRNRYGGYGHIVALTEGFKTARFWKVHLNNNMTVISEGIGPSLFRMRFFDIKEAGLFGAAEELVGAGNKAVMVHVFKIQSTPVNS